MTDTQPTNTTHVSTPLERAENDLTQTIQQFNNLLKPSDEDSLWYAWHFLQVYSTWGLRLPNTEEPLKNSLNISDPGGYLFFGTMLEAHNLIHNASSKFLQTIFPKVVGIGNSMKSFAKDVGDNPNAPLDEKPFFTFLIDLIKDGKTEDAIDLVVDKQKKAKENSEAAKEVVELLSDYKKDLTDAEAKLSQAKGKIEADSQVSQRTIDQLSSGPEIQGSIASLNEEMEVESKHYSHDVKVAATTPTYAWIIPIGTIPAVVVAGVYGDRAVHHLKNIHRVQTRINDASDQLRKAVKTQNIYTLAKNSVVKTTNFTHLAITHATKVQNSWNTIETNLKDLSDEISSMTRETDDGVKLKGIALITRYAQNAGKKWAELIPPLEALTKNPYIQVETGELSQEQLEQAINRLGAES